jgi:polysaccharide chain length determinant protein (PEP-CTERM system associated)
LEGSGLSDVLDVTEMLGQALRAVNKRRWLALATAAAAAVACAVGVAYVPNRYEARAQVYVDTQTALKPLLAGLAFQPDVDTQVRMLARTLISRSNVERLVGMPGLDLGITDEASRQKLITRLTEQIKVVPVPAAAGNLYDITYRGESPANAQRLVEATVQMFVEASSGEKRRDSADTGKFLDDQIRSYETKLVDAEERLKEFKVRNFGVSGVSNQDYYARVSSLGDTVARLRIELSSAEQSRDAFKRELAAEDPNLPAEILPRAAGVPQSETEVRLEAQRKQLDELSRRFTDEHPDVINARRVVAQLEAEDKARKQAEARALAKLGKPAHAPTSPVYQKLRVSLAEAEAQVAALRSQLGLHQSQLEQTRASASQRPQVEAELAQLNRDYEIMRKNYEALVARRESAAIGAKMGEASGYAEFRVVEPARVSGSAAFPNRLHLALISIVVSLAAGVGIALLIERLRPAIDETKALSALSGREVLGVVSMIITPQVLRDKRVGLVRFGMACALLVTLQATWVAWIALYPRFL